jgi:hypothetical protein
MGEAKHRSLSEDKWEAARTPEARNILHSNFKLDITGPEKDECFTLYIKGRSFNLHATELVFLSDIIHQGFLKWTVQASATLTSDMARYGQQNQDKN